MGCGVVIEGIWSQGLIEGMDEDTFEFPMSKPSSKMLYASHTSFDFSESKTTQCMPNFLQSNCPLHAGWQLVAVIPPFGSTFQFGLLLGYLWSWAIWIKVMASQNEFIMLCYGLGAF
ncbi:uncharacterized protein [Physcomitrium patens]|uniref:uncharacterized protein n=1 Tax=Physcomitrium patens TaxID=3218 RepID=UPI000D176A87|nr:uncharacterized protein LOC112279021 [Physcomitrium patens]|eukprot:XP_024368821.1 uncharacterized protein LOC112279021 [Physcomitrella patens]